MNTEDDNIKAFFADMRKEDTQHTIPQFEDLLPKKRASKIRYIIPMGIAASLILGFWMWTGNTEATTVPENTIFITLGETEEGEAILTITLENTRSKEIVQEDYSIYGWESDTAFLIKDFND